MTELKQFGAMASQSAFVPKDFRGRAEDCVLAAMYGAELGLGPMQSLQSIAVVNGRPTVWGDTALALVRSSGLCVGVAEGIDGTGDARHGFCTVTRKGEPPQTRTFSVGQAKIAGLWGKAGPWSAYSDRMLQLRARGFALRDVFPDVLRGMVTAEEAQDYQVIEAPREPVVVRPKFEQPPADPVEASTGVEPLAFDNALRCIARARSLDRLDSLRRTIEERTQEGVFDAEQFESLRQSLQAKAEHLIREESKPAAEAVQS
jgi:hypothetical protein